MLKIHSIDPINKEINLIFTIGSQIKGLLTKTVFLCIPLNFTPHLCGINTNIIP